MDKYEMDMKAIDQVLLSVMIIELINGYNIVALGLWSHLQHCVD